ncbi:MAG: hypothetical protein QXF26_01790 [Candidatus Bathyarchaeia archaeon]
MINTGGATNKNLSQVSVKTGPTSVFYLVNEMAFLRLRKDVDELMRGLFEVEKVLEHMSTKEGEVSILDALKMAGVSQEVFQRYLCLFTP